MKIYSYSPAGYEGQLVDIETDIRRGIPGIDIVGLADGAVRESRDRIRIAIKRSGFEFPAGRIVINLSPAGMKKGGAAHDLPLALSLLLADNQISTAIKTPILVLGELQLSGKILPVHNVVSAIACALEHGVEYFMVPAENYEEAASLGDGSILAAWSLNNALDLLSAPFPDGQNGLPLPEQGGQSNAGYDQEAQGHTVLPDFSMLKGQKLLRRALEVAAAGGHHVLMFGPPGSGKTLSARCFPSILPDLDPAESRELTRVYSAGMTAAGVLKRPQFRAPHHSASCEGILGGGNSLKPGEASFAHRGVLFLDEAPEFQKRVLQALREPLEEGIVRIARAGKNYWYPARFQLLLASNICPCAGLGKPQGSCKCTEKEIKRYWDRLGGALLDRIDIRLPVESVSAQELLKGKSESSKAIRARVEKAHEIQKKRFENSHVLRNAELQADSVFEYCLPEEKALETLHFALEKLSLSSRAGHSVLKIARTIADLEENTTIKKDHVLEALEYRRYGDSDYYWYP